MSYKGSIQPLVLNYEPKEKVDCGYSCNGDKDCANGNVNISNYLNKSSLMKNAIDLPGTSSNN
jgi:hypothetical protein